MDIFNISYLQNFSYIALFFALLIGAKYLYNASTAYCNFVEIIQEKNHALAFSISGFMLAVSIIYIAVMKGPETDFLQDLLNVSLYSIMGLALLLLSRFINNRIILSSFCNQQQITEQQNITVGLTQAASYITSSLIIAGAIAGEGTLYSALVFYALGQLLIIVFSFAYDWLTPFRLKEELEKNNQAVAISYSGMLIALGIILLHALSGSFLDWQHSISQFLFEAALAFMLLPLFRFVIDKVMLPGVKINHAIQEHQNIAVALIEACATICAALVILFAL